MIYAILFEDSESHSDQRAKYMDAHLNFLEANAEIIKAAGPLSDTATNAPAGGLWLVEAENLHAVEALVKADPLSPTGLRKSVKILKWTQVFADGARQI